jgi:hypothetical protein
MLGMPSHIFHLDQQLERAKRFGLDDRIALGIKPALPRAIVVKLDAAAVRIAQIHRDRGAVVFRRIDRILMPDDALHCTSELVLVWNTTARW